MSHAVNRVISELKFYREQRPDPVRSWDTQGPMLNAKLLTLPATESGGLEVANVKDRPSSERHHR